MRTTFLGLLLLETGMKHLTCMEQATEGYRDTESRQCRERLLTD